MTKRNLIVLVVSIPIVLAVLATAGYFVYKYYTTKPQQNDTQTAGWKTYTDSRQRFSIQYPSDWYNFVDIKNDDVVFFSTEGNSSINAVYVHVYTKGNGNEVLNNWRKQGSGYKETYIKVNGYSATKRQESYCMGTPLLTDGVFVEGNDYDFQIQGPISACGTDRVKIQKNYVDAQEIFDQMVSTFKFTK